MALGGKPSENFLSRCLRGIQPMSPQLERRIREILDQDDRQNRNEDQQTQA